MAIAMDIYFSFLSCSLFGLFYFFSLFLSLGLPFGSFVLSAHTTNFIRHGGTVRCLSSQRIVATSLSLYVISLLHINFSVLVVDMKLDRLPALCILLTHSSHNISKTSISSLSIFLRHYFLYHPPCFILRVFSSSLPFSPFFPSIYNAPI